MGKSITKLSSVTRVGLDLAKNAFQVHAVDARERSSLRASSRGAGSSLSSPNCRRCLVAMEGCSSAHHWGRRLMALGFEVRLIPPAHVKPYLRRNKNDAADAAAPHHCLSSGAARDGAWLSRKQTLSCQSPDFVLSLFYSSGDYPVSSSSIR